VIRDRWLGTFVALWALCSAQACGASKEPVVERDFVVANSFNPVKECQTTSFGRFVRGASCPSAELLFISREPSPEVLVASMRKELQSLGQTVETRSLRVNGRDLEALSVAYGPAEKPVVSSLATALALPGSSDSIEVQCFSKERPIDPKRCSSLLDAFIQQGLLRGEWPSVLAQASGRRAIQFDVAGHDVLLPSTCDELGVFDVDCPDGHIQLHMLGSRDQLQPAMKAVLTQKADATLVLEREIECAVEGLPTMCVVRKSRLPFGDWLHSYTAALDVRGVPLLIACDTRASRSSLLPGAVCSRVISFADGALEEPPANE